MSFASKQDSLRKEVTSIDMEFMSMFVTHKKVCYVYASMFTLNTSTLPGVKIVYKVLL